MRIISFFTSMGLNRLIKILTKHLAIFIVLLITSCNTDTDALVVSGRVEMDRAHVGSKLGGRVVAVNFEEGEEATAGEAVVELERDELEAEMAQAKAGLAQTQAELDLLLAGARAEDIRRAEAVVAARQAEVELRQKGFRDEEVREAEAQLASAKSSAELAAKERERADRLFESGSINEQERDARRSAAETAQAALDIADQRLQLIRSGSRPEEIAMAESNLAQALAEADRLKNGARPEEIAAARAAVAAAEAHVLRVETQLAETRITAPADATVEVLDLQQGDLVRAGQTVAVLTLKRAPWVRCYVPENRLGIVHPGDKVFVTVDTFPDRKFEGIVRRVNSEAEFTPRNVQTTEKRSELVFEAKVDVTGDGADALRPGMYADVHITSGSAR